MTPEREDLIRDVWGSVRRNALSAGRPVYRVGVRSPLRSVDIVFPDPSAGPCDVSFTVEHLDFCLGRLPDRRRGVIVVSCEGVLLEEFQGVWR